MSAKNVTVTVASVVVAEAGFIKWIQGTGTTYTVAVDTQTDYITVTDAAAAVADAPADADYLVGTANSGLSAEIAVGTSPGGELGGTWASPTVDATHSGSAHLATSDFRTDVTFSKAGVLATGAGTFRWYNKSGRTLTLYNATLAVGTAPLNQSILVDVNVDGTTCFASGGQANRPAIAASANTGETTTFDSISTISTGAHYITVDIDQVGTGTLGSDLTVTIWMTG